MNRTVSLAAAAVIGLSLFSCSALKIGNSSKDITMTGNSALPAAQGVANVSTTDNGNTQVNLEVKHLAPPERVNPGATVFVVWAQGNVQDAQPQNLGALRVNNDLEGNLETVTSLKSFELFVTAEPSSTVPDPSGETILHTNVSVD